MGIHEGMYGVVFSGDQPVFYAVEHFYKRGLDDFKRGKYLPPAGPDTDSCVRAYQDGYDCADRLRHVLPEDIIRDELDRATGEGRR